MAKKLYVGNLSYGMTDTDLQNLPASHGTVQSCQVIIDRDSNQSKGFGFVEMSTDQEAQEAIKLLNDKEGADLLQTTLEEERATDQKLTKLAKSEINVAAAK